MSSLGLTLLILIVVVIGGLALFNYWTQRKPGSRSLADSIADASESGDRTEPSLGFDEEPGRAPHPERPVPSFDVPSHPDAGAAQSRPGSGSEQNSEGLAALPEWATGDDFPDGETPAVVPGQDRQPPPADKPAGASTPGLAADKMPADEGDNDPPQDMQAWLAGARRDLAQKSAPLTALDESSQDETDSQASGQPGGFVEPDPKTDSPAVLASKHDGLASPGNNRVSAAPDSLVDSAQTERAREEGRDAAIGSGARQSEAFGSATATGNNDTKTNQPPDAGPEDAPAQEAVERVDPAATATSTQVANDFFTTVNLDLPQPVSGQKLLNATKDFSSVGSKPVWISAGQRLDASTVRTSMIEPDQSYALLRFDLLQVNRQGPLTGVEYSDFVRRINDIADELGVLANTPDMNIVLIRSRVMDAEVASLDAQVAINVEAEDPITTDQFTDCANEIGLRRGPDGLYLHKDQSGHILNTVSHEPGSNRIVLVLDVPTVPAELMPIRKVVECAWKIAQSVHGQMIDDSGRSINNALFERIESQIATHYRALEAAGLPAGAELTRHVYNVGQDLAELSPNSES